MERYERRGSKTSFSDFISLVVLSSIDSTREIPAKMKNLTLRYFYKPTVFRKSIRLVQTQTHCDDRRQDDSACMSSTIFRRKSRTNLEPVKISYTENGISRPLFGDGRLHGFVCNVTPNPRIRGMTIK